MPPIAALATLLLALGQTPPTPAVAEPLPAGPDDRYQVFLLTIDQGDQVWERFGHNAIRIRDRLTGQDLAWNWGLFNFEDADFVPRFLRGRMLYSMGPAETGAFLDAYRGSGRSVYSNEIFLSVDEAAELDRLVRENFEPENRDYVYHYFEDNCSTRVRDMLDTVLGGSLFDAFASADTGRSYRWHARRLVGETPWLDQGLSFLLGSRGDAPRSEWAAMFIPMELMRSLETFERPGGASGTGPLLGPGEVLVESGRPAAPAAPPAFSPWWLLLGGGGGATLLRAGGAAARGSAAALRVLVVAIAVWGTFAGLLGALLVSAWFTDHDFITWNANLLHLSPLALVLTGLLGAGSWREGWERGPVGRRATHLAMAIALLSAGAGALQLLSLYSQGNAEVLAVAVPMNAAVAVALLTATRAERGEAGDATALSRPGARRRAGPVRTRKG